MAEQVDKDTAQGIIERLNHKAIVWEAKYYEALHSLRAANRGVTRLSRKCRIHREQLADLKAAAWMLFTNSEPYDVKQAKPGWLDRVRAMVEPRKRKGE